MAAKLGLAALAVGVAAGGTWFAVGLQKTRANPAAPTTQSATGTVPAEPPELTMSGPAAVPYGEPAVFTVTLTNTTALPVVVKQMDSTGGLWANGLVPSWSPDHGGRASQETVEPGTSFTWNMTYSNTRFLIMDQYNISVDLRGDYLGLAPYDGRPKFQDFSLTADFSLTIASPVRSLDSYWDDWCDLMKDWYSAQETSREMRSTKIDCLSGHLEDDPKCPDVYLSQEYSDELNRVLLLLDALDAKRFSYMDEDGLDNRFTRLSDQYACSCWCRYSGESTCYTIPWGTDADLPEGDNPDHIYDW